MLTNKSYKIVFESKEIIPDPLNETLNANDSNVSLTNSTTEEKNNDLENLTKKTNDNAGLNEKYTFENFIIGSNNRFAHAAAVAVSENPGKEYNPLFIYGGVGLGKTHLMQAIGNYMYKSNPNTRIIYCTGEVFANEVISAIMNSQNESFRKKFRNIDLLLIDDSNF